MKKYALGPGIKSVDEAINQKFIYLNNKIYHRGWFMSWPVRMLQDCVSRRLVYRTLRIGRGDTYDADTTSIEGVLVDIDTRTLGPTTIEDDYQIYCDMLVCKNIHVSNHRIGNMSFSIFSDDSRFYNRNKPISAVNRQYETVFTGNLFITKFNEEGEVISLTEEETVKILENSTIIMQNDIPHWVIQFDE